MVCIMGLLADIGCPLAGTGDPMAVQEGPFAGAGVPVADEGSCLTDTESSPVGTGPSGSRCGIPGRCRRPYS